MRTFFFIHKIYFYMLTIATFLVGLWFFGLMLSVTLGGMIHLLLVVGLVIALKSIIEESSSSYPEATA